ncbi:MAG: pentapeptide repeat-containing protein [Lachnospiraceae bacterium]|nr:pentapeptide repeat-containing protein [Lachnospiraceae bacterium]
MKNSFRQPKFNKEDAFLAIASSSLDIVLKAGVGLANPRLSLLFTGLKFLLPGLLKGVKTGSDSVTNIYTNTFNDIVSECAAEHFALGGGADTTKDCPSVPKSAAEHFALGGGTDSENKADGGKSGASGSLSDSDKERIASIIGVLKNIKLEKINVYANGDEAADRNRVICDALNKAFPDITIEQVGAFMSDITFKMCRAIEKNDALRSYVAEMIMLESYESNGGVFAAAGYTQADDIAEKISEELKELLSNEAEIREIIAGLERSILIKVEGTKKELVAVVRQETESIIENANNNTEKITGRIDFSTAQIIQHGDINTAVILGAINQVEKEIARMREAAATTETLADKVHSKIRELKTEYIIKWFGELFLNGLRNDNKKLKDTYIYHNYERYDKEKDKFVSDYNENSREDYSEKYAHLNSIFVDTFENTKRKEFETMLVDEIIESDDRKTNGSYLVTGVPGIGKTSLAAFLANRYCFDDNVIIINFSSLNQWFNKSAPSDRTILDATALELGIENGYDGLLFYINNCSENVTIIYDGFDEFIAGTVYRICELFDDANKINRVKVIVTSRDAYVRRYAKDIVAANQETPTSNPIEHKFKNVKADANDVKGYVKAWYRLEEFSESKIREYYKIITGKELTGSVPEKNLEVVGVPVILYMCLALEHRIDITEDTSRYTMYKRIFALNGGIFDCFEKIDESNDGYKLKENVKIREVKEKFSNLLQMLAYKIFDTGKDSPIKKEDYILLAENIIQEVFDGVIDAAVIMEYPVKNVFEKDANEIEFVHKTIYEYFMALGIFNCLKGLYDTDCEFVKDYLSQREYHNFESRFVKELGSLLKSGELVRNNETAIYDFLKEMLTEYYNESSKDSLTDSHKGSFFAKNLANMSILSAAFGRMFNKGLSFYTIDSNAEYVENSGRSFNEVQVQEQICFKNMIDLINLIREITGNSDEPFESKFGINGAYYKKNMGRYLKMIHYDRLNLSGFDLSGLDMPEYDLSGADMSEYILKNVNLSSSVLNGANLQGAVLDGSDIVDAELVGCSIKKASLIGATIKGSNFTNCNLEFADLRDAVVEDCNLTGAHLAGIRGDIEAIRGSEKHNTNNIISWSTDFAGANFRRGIEKELVPGNLYEFGSYPQGANGEVKPILWRVLDIVGGYALLLSDKILDSKPYHKEYEDITWDKCTLNEWLNKGYEAEQEGDKGFYDTAFNDADKLRIANINSGKVKIESDVGRGDGCREIFLLSEDEHKQYFYRSTQKKMRDEPARKLNPEEQQLYDIQKELEDKFDEVFGEGDRSRAAEAFGTEYAKKSRLYASSGNGRSVWWLRLGGSGGSRYVMFVDFDGDVRTRGFFVHDADVGVRPALWLNLKS